jgi:hypothetical protein
MKATGGIICYGSEKTSKLGGGWLALPILTLVTITTVRLGRVAGETSAVSVLSLGAFMLYLPGEIVDGISRWRFGTISYRLL